jgi:hypothetical protein
VKGCVEPFILAVVGGDDHCVRIIKVESRKRREEKRKRGRRRRVYLNGVKVGT